MQWSDRIGRRLKLHDLHVLMMVVQAGSMRKAAERLNSTQPANPDQLRTWNVRLGCVSSIAVARASSRLSTAASFSIVDWQCSTIYAEA